LWLPTLSLSYCPPADADHLRLCDHGASGGGLVLPVGGQDTDGPVVAGETVDTGLDQNEAELGVLVLAVALEVLADGDGLFPTRVSMSTSYHQLPRSRLPVQLYVRTFLTSM